jgi:hypothetical protein
MTPNISLPLSKCICGKMECKITFGACHCGCGGTTRISSRNDKRSGERKGYPVRFVHGHHRTIERPDMNEVAHFKIEGVYCRLIALTQGLYAIAWESDYESLSKYNWFAKWDDGVKGFYACRNIKINGKWTSISMHRQLLGLGTGDIFEGDHKDPLQTLDNRRDNIRIANRDEQMRNRRLNKRNTSGYKEVSLTPSGKSYRARISIDGVRVHLGVRKTAKAAHDELFVPAALKHYGEFARFK